jgi:ubiquinone/menaquinone biosynthesis C-methylase UbiE
MKKRFQQVIRWYFDRLYQAMCVERYSVQLQLVEPYPYALLLDCGCREGDNTIRLSQRIGNQKNFGLDVIPSALLQASKKGIVCVQSNLNKSIPLQTETFDLIVGTDVIEHLINPTVFVKEMFRVLKPNGYMILDTPNLASWHNIFALLLGVQPFSGPNITTMEDSDIGLVKQMHRATHGLQEDGEFYEHGEQELTRHIIVIAYNSLTKLLKDAGFQIEKSYGFGYYPFPSFLAHFFQRVDIRHTHHLLIKARKVL